MMTPVTVRARAFTFSIEVDDLFGTSEFNFEANCNFPSLNYYLGRLFNDIIIIIWYRTEN